MGKNLEWTTIDAVLERLLKRDSTSKLQKSDVIDYTTEFIGILQRTELLFENVAEVEVEDGIGYLPSGVVNVEGVIAKASGVPLLKSNSFSIDTLNHSNSGHGFYMIKGNVIYSSYTDCVLVIKYYGLPIDEHEQLLVPSNPVFIKALVSYIVFELASANLDTTNQNTRLANMQTYQIRQNEYYKDFDRLDSMLRTPSVDEVILIANELNSLLPRRSEWFNSFRKAGLTTYTVK
jgi:hypothetical protein